MSGFSLRSSLRHGGARALCPAHHEEMRVQHDRPHGREITALLHKEPCSYKLQLGRKTLINALQGVDQLRRLEV